MVETLAQRVLATVHERDAGHCLQVPHIPATLADGACKRLIQDLTRPDVAYVVTAEPTKPWQAKPETVVECRNEVDETRGRLVVFVPAGVHLAAEDSFGRSTFEVMDVSDLYGSVSRRLRDELEVIAPDLIERVDAVIAAARTDSRFAVGERDEAAYLARVVRQPTDDAIGRSLVEMGLMPDPALTESEPGGIPVRLARNLQQMENLTELAPPADRIQRIAFPADEESNGKTAALLLEALDDGTVDRRELARRLDTGEGAARGYSRLIDESTARTSINELTILQLKGDFKPEVDPLTIAKAKAKLRIRFHCRPPANAVTGLKELRLELMRVEEQGNQLSEVGVEATKRSNALPKAIESNWALTISAGDLDTGFYQLRLQAIDENNLTLAEAFSERFVVHEEMEETDDEVRIVPSIEAARVAARCADDALRSPGEPRISISDSNEKEGARPTLQVGIRFESIPGRSQVLISRVLAQVEGYTLADPTSLARYRVSLVENEVTETLEADVAAVPEAFLVARSELFEEIVRCQYASQADHDPLVALCDLAPLTRQIDRYLAAWREALESVEDPSALRTLLSVDQVVCGDEPFASAVLVGPTHPLRMAWLSRYHQVLRGWLDDPDASAAEARELRSAMSQLAPVNLPHAIVEAEYGELRFLEPIDLYWGIWAPPSAPDVQALAAMIRNRIGLFGAGVGGISVDNVVERIRRYLAAHPYVELLKVNFVQPGLGQIVLDALLTLQSDPAMQHLRYVLRLFATELSRSELGRALDEFMADPEGLRGGRRDAADSFLASTEEPLLPKLTYSKHETSELLEGPERFPAHLTIFLDWFELDIVPAPPLEGRRSFFASGLVIDPVIVFRASEGDMNPIWDEHVAVPANSSDPFLLAYRACEDATARLLAPDAKGTVPAVRLELDRVRRSILDAVHRTSDWVVVIDPVFTDDYLDAPVRDDETPRYLIDSTDIGDSRPHGGSSCPLARARNCETSSCRSSIATTSNCRTIASRCS